MAFHPKTSYGEEERPTSKFNAAEAQNFRLDNLWQNVQLFLSMVQP